MLNLCSFLKRGARVFIGWYYGRLVSQNYQRCRRLEEFFIKSIRHLMQMVIYVLQVEGNLDTNDIILLKEKIIKNYKNNNNNNKAGKEWGSIANNKHHP